MREEREIIGYIVSQRRVSSSLQEEGDGGFVTSTGGIMERSVATLQIEEGMAIRGGRRGRGDLIPYIYFRSSLQEEGDGGIITLPGGHVKRSPAILQKEEMRERDGNQRRDERDKRHYPGDLSPLLSLGGGRRWHLHHTWR
jgi:hypothetical protein